MLSALRELLPEGRVPRSRFDRALAASHEIRAHLEFQRRHPARSHLEGEPRRARGSAPAEASEQTPRAMHRLVAIQPELLLGLDLFPFGEKLRSESLTLADPFDLDRSRFDDLLDAIESRQQLGISIGQHGLPLSSALAEEIGAEESAGEDANAGEDTNQRNDDSQISRHSVP